MKNYATTEFLFDGDHGDAPEPGQVMTWSQWDDLPLAIINDNGNYLACIVVEQDCKDSRAAIQAARTALNTWTEDTRTVEYLDKEIRRLSDQLAYLMDCLDMARAFGHEDRVTDLVSRVPALAKEISGLTAAA